MRAPSIRNFLIVSLVIALTLEVAVYQFFKNHIYSILIITVIFIILIGLITSKILTPIRKLARNLEARNATQLEAISINGIPIEFIPLVKELNNLFQRMRHASEVSKRFSSDAAHELRTPLSAIKTQAQVAVNAKHEAELKIALENVIRGVDRSSHVIEQLLILGRLEPEAELNDMAPVNLEKLSAEMIALLVPHALEKNIDIELITEKPNLKIVGNEVSLAILIRNLVDNAIRYTPENGRVSVSIFTKKDRVAFRVVDNGPGIPPDLHERIFERFFRILGTKATGSGLGLAIVKQIADLHKATIHLCTPVNNEGLCIEVAFLKY